MGTWFGIVVAVGEQGGEDVEGDEPGVKDEREEVVGSGAGGRTRFGVPEQVVDGVEGGCDVHTGLFKMSIIHVAYMHPTN